MIQCPSLLHWTRAIFFFTLGTLGCSLVCSLASAAAEEGAARPLPLYRLQPGDEVAISVLPQNEYDCGGIILPDGLLYLKNIGKIAASGLTIDQLTEQVQKVLDRDLVAPRISVTLVKMASPMKEAPRIGQITIVGAVRKTGPMELVEGLRVRKALDLAGGTEKEADLTNIVIFHRDLTRTTVNLSTDERVSDPTQNRLLQDGDSVEVRSLVSKPADTVRISGQVLNPGQQELKPAMTLEDLIIAAGKLLPLADVEHVELRRNNARQTVNLLARQKLGLNGKVPLEPGDEVFIPALEHTVFLIGAVQSPGPKPLNPGQTVRDFFLRGGADLAAALNPAAVSLEEVQLIRRGKEPEKVNLAAVLKRPERKDNLALQSGDILFVPPKKDRKRGPLDYLSQLGAASFLFALF